MLPNYELNYRVYFEDQECFRQRYEQDLSVNSEQEDEILSSVEALSERERLELFSEVIPSFSDLLNDLFTKQLEYKTYIRNLIQRNNKNSIEQVKK